MATKLSFKFTLDMHLGFPPPAVRIWVDVDNDFRPDNNEEVSLTQNGLEWTGTFQVNAESSAGVWYLVAFAASPDSKYSLEVKSDRPQDHPVAIGSGTVRKLRETFWGMCAG